MQNGESDETDDSSKENSIDSNMHGVVRGITTDVSHHTGCGNGDLSHAHTSLTVRAYVWMGVRINLWIGRSGVILPAHGDAADCHFAVHDA